MSARADIQIYVTSQCPYCTAAKQLLKRKQAPFTEIDVGERPDLRRWLISASGQRTVPQIFINGEPVGGFSDMSELDRQGKLDPMLATAPDPGRAALPR